jgi:SAM-dependent methyltransferase
MTWETVKRDLREAYDRTASARDRMDDAAWKQPERKRFRLLLREIGAANLLEIGAGHGVSGRYFADQGLDVVCVDLSPELVERCRAKGLSARVMDFGTLEFPPGSFDAVFGMNCLLHVPSTDLDRVLRSVRRVLAPGGLFYWGQYGGRDLEEVWDGDDHRPKRFFSLLTDDRIRRTGERMFEVVDFRSLPLDRRIRYQAMVLRRPEATS